MSKVSEEVGEIWEDRDGWKMRRMLVLRLQTAVTEEYDILSCDAV
jgi:hypothetical protein